MTRQFFATLIILTIYLTSFGQHDFGFKLSGGLSYLSTKVTGIIVDPSISPPPPKTAQTFFYMPSGQVGLFYNFHFNKQSVFGVELLFSQIEGKEHDKTPATDFFGNPTGQFVTGNNFSHISYLSIPLYYGYNYKKISVNVGIQTSFLLHASSQSKFQAPDYNGNIQTFNSSSSELPLKYFDLGLRGGIIYSLTNKFSIEGTYYYGLLNIHEHNYSDAGFVYKVQQMTIGIRYKFFMSKPRTEK